MRDIVSAVILLAAVLCSSAALAWYPRLPEESLLDGRSPVTVIGENRRYFVGPGDTLVQLARAAGLGFESLQNANPGVDPWLLEAGRQIILPYATILTERLHLGITVNLADRRLYFLWRDGEQLKVRIYPVGIGTEGWETPEGEFAIREKIVKPSWTVPKQIRQEQPELPASVPPGPDNPLGDYWMKFSSAGHGLHGTNEPYGVGRKVSHGCIRLYPEDIRDLYRRAKVGTPVYIVYQPIKVGIRHGVLFLEAHPDTSGRVADPWKEVRRQAGALGWRGKLYERAVTQVLKERRGIPLPISPPPA